MNLIRPVTDRITIADQPAADDLTAFKRDGFVGVLNLRNDGEPEQPLSVAEEGSAVRGLGMAYHHLGVGAEPLSDPGVAAACGFIDHCVAEGRVLVHCRKGGRAAALVLIQQARAHGWTADEAIAKGRELGIQLDGALKDKVEGYLRSKA